MTTNFGNKVSHKGFGNYCRAEHFLQRPERQRDLKDSIVNRRPGETLVPRGLGRSYGDAALNSSNLAVSTEKLDRFLNLDNQTRVLTVESGAKVIDVMDLMATKGLTLPVVPGLSDISIGGCVAFDIHTKNHWLQGGFGDNVQAFTLMLANGDLVECSRIINSDLFFATIGGLGLTGMITTVDLQLMPLHGKSVRNNATRFNDIDSLLDTFEAAASKSSHVVGWLDLLNKSCVSGFVLASSIVDEENLDASDLFKRKSKKPLNLIAPFYNKLSNKLFNAAFSLKHILSPNNVTDLDSFLFPWDALSNWNELYGKKGFVEYQCCIPLQNAKPGLQKLITTVLNNKSQCPCYFGAIKKMRNGAGMLSFPVEGYSLLMDFPIHDKLWSFVNELDKIVIEFGGRVYLAKDSRLPAEHFAQMYPLRNQWLEIRNSVDPHNRFSSDMGRRLKLSNF